MNEPNKGLATRDDKIRGLISVVLMFAGFIFAFYQTDQAMAAGGICAGVLYMLTVFAIMFKDVDTIDS